MQRNKLIEKYLPEFTFNEYHEIVVNRPIENVYEIAKNFDLSKSRIIKFLFKIRGLPTKRLNLQHFINDMGFTYLEENYPNETLIGFWARFKIARIQNYKDFINNSISPWIKVVWNFQFEKIEENKTKVSTETRVLCVAKITKFTFGSYWLIVKPFSGLTRTQMLKIIKNESESEQIKARGDAVNYMKEEKMEHKNWECPKCQTKEFETGQFAATGGGLTKFFNIQSKRFSTLTCTRCKYTEIYQAETSTLSNVLDFLGN